MGLRSDKSISRDRGRPLARGWDGTGWPPNWLTTLEGRFPHISPAIETSCRVSSRNLVLNAHRSDRFQGQERPPSAVENGASMIAGPAVVGSGDNGWRGMTDEFIKNSLFFFRPLSRTTKKKGIGIGMFQAKTGLSKRNTGRDPGKKSAPGRGKRRFEFLFAG